MDQDLYKSQQIDKYLDGLMEIEEKDRFEHEMNNDAALSKSVRIRKDVISGIHLYGDKRLKNMLVQVESKLEIEGFFLNEEHIRQFLMNDLDDSLSDKFAKRLETDEDFAKEVDFQNDLLSGISKFGKVAEESELLNVRKKMENEDFFDKIENDKWLHNTSSTKPSARIISIFNRRQIAVAAGMLLLIAASLFFIFKPNQFDQFYLANYRVEKTKLSAVLDDLESSGMGIADKKRREQLLEILLLYESNKFVEALPLFENHLYDYPDDQDARFYYGVSLLETKKYAVATKEFETLLNKSGSWNQDAKWYLALSFLKIRKSQEEAVTLFKEIADDKNSPYQSKALKLLNELQ